MTMWKGYRSVDSVLFYNVIGTTVGNFKVERLLGEGGMGKVYAATHPGIGRQVAIKVLASREMIDSQVVVRFLKEARAASSIHHPNIVDIYDAGLLGDRTPYIVMEYLEGESLARVLERGRPDLDEALDWASQVAEALSATHAKHVIHRDLKPANLFLIEDPLKVGKRQVKVLDFGIAKLRKDPDDSANRTQTGALLGTPLYMSPEQCLGLQELDERSDIYSFGVVLYEMVTGHRPFDVPGLYPLMDMHVRETPVSPIVHQPSLPAELATIILQTLAKSPNDRPSSIAGIGTELRCLRRTAFEGEQSIQQKYKDPPQNSPFAPSFSRQHLYDFLTEVDRGLREPLVLEIVGDSAAVLAYGATRSVPCISSYSAVDARIVRVSQSIEHALPVHQHSPHYLPRGYPDRRERLKGPWKNLIVWLPERHDIFLICAQLGTQRELELLAEMHLSIPFDLGLLVERHNEESGGPSLEREAPRRRLQMALEYVFGPNVHSRFARLTES